VGADVPGEETSPTHLHAVMVILSVPTGACMAWLLCDDDDDDDDDEQNRGRIDCALPCHASDRDKRTSRVHE